MGIELPKIEYPDGVDMEFHDHLKRLRETKGLTQAQVAESVGLAKNTYIGYEKGSREPRLSELKKLAALFQVELGELCLESHGYGLSGWLKASLKRVDGLKAKEKASLLEVVNGYITACEVAQISNSRDYYEFMDELNYQHHLEMELAEELREEMEEEHARQTEELERFHQRRQGSSD